MTDRPDVFAPQPRRRAWAMAATGLALVAVLVSLGSWQLQRREWKLALIAQVEERVHAAAVPAPAPALWAHFDGTGMAYRHVSVTGTWLPERSAWVTAATALGSGYWLLTPLRLADGSSVWVNRGYVSQASRARWPTSAASAEASVTGLLRLTEPGGTWLRRNDPAAERWYARDLVALSQRRGLDRTAPFFIDADASPHGAEPATEPVAGLTVVSFPNDHLAYALTWYTLALLTAWATWSVWQSGPADKDADHAGLD